MNASWIARIAAVLPLSTDAGKCLSLRASTKDASIRSLDTTNIACALSGDGTRRLRQKILTFQCRKYLTKRPECLMFVLSSLQGFVTEFVNPSVRMPCAYDDTPGGFHFTPAGHRVSQPGFSRDRASGPNNRGDVRQTSRPDKSCSVLPFTTGAAPLERGTPRATLGMRRFRGVRQEANQMPACDSFQLPATRCGEKRGVDLIEKMERK